jgi:DNA repair exonuclease SbcCD nuclease subunit
MVDREIIRAVVTADNHLNRFYDRMPPQKLAQRRRYLREGFKAAVEHAVQWPAHLFFIAGDLFDQPDPRNVDRAFVAHCLGRLREAGVQIFAVSGNHDTPRQSTEQGGSTPQEVYAQLGALTLFEESTEITTEIIEVSGLRVAIGGLAPDPSAPSGSNPLEGIVWADRPADAALGILLLHAQVEGYALADTREPIIPLRALEAQPADAFLVGDIHRPAVRHLGERLLIIPGATERMTFGEDPGVPGFVALELGRGGVHGYERIPLAGQPRAELTVRVAELDSQNMLASLLQKAEAVATPETLVKVRLEGIITRERYHALELRRLYEAMSRQAFHFTLDTGGLLIEDERHQLAERGVRFSQQEEIRTYADEMIAAATNRAEREVIEEAVQRLLASY